MAGEGESEKRRAVSAAAKMGIRDLVDVAQRAEVGVQTDPVAEDQVTYVGWTGEVMESSTVLWSETNGGKYVQTGGPQVSSCPPVPTYETIDMSLLQSLRHPPDHNPHSTPDTAPQSLPSKGTLWPAHPHAFFSGAVEGELAGDEQLEQYRDNIPGFISHFLNSDRREAARAKTKARGAKAAVQRMPGRPRGGWMQKVDVQTVAPSKQHRSLLHRCGTAAAVRTGRGGGATGRKLYLKTRHILHSFWRAQRKRGRGAWKGFSPGGESHYEMGGGGNVTCRPRTKQECQQVSPAVPRPPPHEDPSERFNCLFEEVLIGLNAPHSQHCQQRYSAVTTEVVANGRAGAGDADAEVGFLEPQVEGDLTAMLEDFLQSLEQHGDGGVVREVEHCSPGKQSQRSKASVRGKAAGNTGSKKRPSRQEKKQTPDAVSDIINRKAGEGDNKRLGRTSVVKVRQQSALQVNTSTMTITVQKNPARSALTYPVRSRRKKVRNMPLPEIKMPRKAPRSCSPRKNTRRLSPITEIPGTPAGHGDLIKRSQERGGNNAAEEKEGKEGARRAQKRHLKPREEMRNIASEAKKKYFEANPPPSSSTSTSDEMVVHASIGDIAPVDHIGEQNQDLANREKQEGSCGNKAAPCLSATLLSSWEVRPESQDEEEDIDVVGTWDSIPDPITITWSTSSGSEDEEIDVTEVSGLRSEPSCGPHVLHQGIPTLS
ncbi:uncharacterized protein LOC133552337 isoform X2 [Nerophis ophidion]|nr:uncharacterized protein LOC133552337 isoform X2 [Nerophis ophidion]